MNLPGPPSIMRPLLLVFCLAAASALHLPVSYGCVRARGSVRDLQMGEGDELGGAISSTFSEIFSSMFKPSAAKQAEIDRAYAEQLEVAERRRNPKAYAEKLAATEARRARESAKFKDKFGWQSSKDPLAEFKKRRKDGRIKDLSYDDTPKGGIRALTSDSIPLLRNLCLGTRGPATQLCRELTACPAACRDANGELWSRRRVWAGRQV